MQTLIALEERRCRLLESGDLAGIEAMLDPYLLYVHSTGVIHNKPELLEFLAHRIRYLAVQREGLTVHGGGGVALMTGLMQLRGERVPGGEAVASTAFVSQLWVAVADQWTLRGFQATRVEDSVWTRSRDARAAK